MKIRLLVDENSNGRFDGEHGLSLLIEDNNLRILFDTGQTGLFLDNAKKMNIDLHNVNYVVLSHAHYDHTGGLKRFVEENNYHGPILVGNGFSNNKYKKVDNDFVYIGTPFTCNDFSFTTVCDSYKISDDITLYGNAKKTNDFEEIEKKFFLKNQEKDSFTDEIFLTINTSKGLILICGCSHIGIVNIIEDIKRRTKKEIYAFIGGTHLVNASDERKKKTIDYLQNIPYVYACHCSGEVKFKEVKIGDALFDDKKEYLKLLQNQKKKPDYKKEMYQAWTDKNYKDGDKN